RAWPISRVPPLHVAHSRARDPRSAPTPSGRASSNGYYEPSPTWLDERFDSEQSRQVRMRVIELRLPSYLPTARVGTTESEHVRSLTLNVADPTVITIAPDHRLKSFEFEGGRVPDFDFRAEPAKQAQSIAAKT